MRPVEILSGPSLWAWETREATRVRKEGLREKNKKDLQALKMILNGHKIIIAKSGQMKLELIDGSIGNDLKGNEYVGANLTGQDILEQYRIHPWGLDSVFAPCQETLITGVNIPRQVGSYLASSDGYWESRCSQSTRVVSFVREFLLEATIVGFKEAADYRRTL